MKRCAAAILPIVPLLLLLLPGVGRAAEESLGAVEKDLSSVLKEMDAMSSELDRIKETVAVPRASSIRVEIVRGGDVPAPVAARLYIGGKVEEERDWSKGERDAFLGGSPLVFQVPLLPAAYAGRFEITHASWKTLPAVEFKGDLGKGETLLLRVKLHIPPGKNAPILSPVTEK